MTLYDVCESFFKRYDVRDLSADETTDKDVDSFFHFIGHATVQLILLHCQFHCVICLLV
jgi:hypothetical protein